MICLYDKSGPRPLIAFELEVIPRVSSTLLRDKFVSYTQSVPENLDPVNGYRITRNKLVNVAQGASFVRDALEGSDK